MYQHIARNCKILCKKRHHEIAFFGIQKSPYYTQEKALLDHKKHLMTAQKAPFRKQVWRCTAHKQSETAFPHTFSGLSILYFANFNCKNFLPSYFAYLCKIQEKAIKDILTESAWDTTYHTTVCPTIKVDIDVSQAQSEAPILPELHIWTCGEASCDAIFSFHTTLRRYHPRQPTQVTSLPVCATYRVWTYICRCHIQRMSRHWQPKHKSTTGGQPANAHCL